LTTGRMTTLGCSVLRPYLHHEIRPIYRKAHARLFAAFQHRSSHTPAADPLWSSTSYRRRVSELRDVHKASGKGEKSFPGSLYPRMPAGEAHNTRAFTLKFGSMDKEALAAYKEYSYTVNGRRFSPRVRPIVAHFVRQSREDPRGWL
jgi:hypothetical protein